MPGLVNAVPKYRKHRASGQAIVTLLGQDHYLGPHGSQASRDRYDQLIAEYLSTKRSIVPGDAAVARSLTVVELLAEYWSFCKTYYVKNGQPTNEQDAMRLIIQDMRGLYETTPVTEFGPKCLKAVRHQWIDRGQSRPTINKNMRRLTRIFKWGVAEELVLNSTYQALTTVPGLKKGRTDVPEPPPVLPVEIGQVEQTMPFLPSIIRDMVRVQLLTGMRPGEICRLRPLDVDRSLDIWEYRPESHKTEHHERDRTEFIGPEAQAVLGPYLNREVTLPCFSPAESMCLRRKQLEDARVTPISCGNKAGTNRRDNPKKQPRVAYDPNSYRQAVHRACALAFPPEAPLARLEGESKASQLARLSEEQIAELKVWHRTHRWTPNQLRHTAATSIRKQFGLEAAQIILGHAAADVTQVYAERDADKARAVAKAIG